MEVPSPVLAGSIDFINLTYFFNQEYELFIQSRPDPSVIVQAWYRRRRIGVFKPILASQAEYDRSFSGLISPF